MSIDLEQFHHVFFEESLEALDIMEQSLLEISGGGSNAELINTIFRAAHSIKGGSGTFGFNNISDFTHLLETLLDEARDGQRELSEEIIELLLQSSDCLRHMIEGHQNNRPVDDSEVKPLEAAFRELLDFDQSTTDAGVPESADTSASDSSAVNATGTLPSSTEGSHFNGSDGSNDDIHQQWTIHFAPEHQILLSGNEPLRIFRELETLGKLTVKADIDHLPTFSGLTVDECFIHWALLLEGQVSKKQIIEVFEWVLDECELSITPAADSVVTKESADEALMEVPVEGDSLHSPNQEQEHEQELIESETTAVANAEQSKASKASTGSNSSIRVGIDKVDSLINLVGELVITQSMLSELGNNFEMDKLERLTNGLEQLLQNTKELQESVMRIRMLPISFAFNRFPRMIRDLSAKTGKKVSLNVSGDQTELDKTVMEQIGDPLVHLVRNAIDHGIETAEERKALGKPETGSIHLDAYHKGGNIVIEIGDDGRGLNPKKILAKAREKGIVERNEELTNKEIYELIFEPGFSTVEEVSDISGRGVGMDVVRRNIKALGGRIDIESEIDEGTNLKIYLPLTLAILDGQLVRVGTETYIIPLISIVESLQIKAQQVNEVSGNMMLYRLREDNVPIAPIYQLFAIDAENTELSNGLLVVVEGDGQKLGLLVDDLLAQQQVVIKSLESNYKQVQGISGATILGDGSVALILDIPGLIARATRPSSRSKAA